MKGYKAMIGLNLESGYSFNLTLTKKEAEEWIETAAKGTLWEGKVFQSKIEPIELEKCNCGELMEKGEIECLRCDHIRADCTPSRGSDEEGELIKEAEEYED